MHEKWFESSSFQKAAWARGWGFFPRLWLVSRSFPQLLRFCWSQGSACRPSPFFPRSPSFLGRPRTSQNARSFKSRETVRNTFCGRKTRRGECYDTAKGSLSREAQKQAQVKEFVLSMKTTHPCTATSGGPAGAIPAILPVSNPRPPTAHPQRRAAGDGEDAMHCLLSNQGDIPS